MQYLIDTHMLLWMAWNSPKLSERATEISIDSGSDLIVSIASLWEISLKLNKGGFSENFAIEDIISYCGKQFIAIQPISIEAVTVLATLPRHADHNDPFDRIIVCSCLAHKRQLLSADAQLDRYGIDRIW